MHKQNWNAVTIHENINKKYDTQFNFFLTKNTNQIIYNHILSPNFIDFKDQVIFADNNQYLKRYYFLKNSLDKDQIFDRINLLAQFYGNAILLKYQYPLMILTRTKSIFLKRLKRMKKYLVEEGSSDDSNSQKNQQNISINSSQFLKSISSSELQRKSMDDTNNLQLDFSLFKDDEFQTHEIYSPQIEEEETSNKLFLANITKFTKQIACQLNLEKQHSQDQVSHLTVDFDEFDTEDVIKKYKRICQKQNRLVNSGKQLNSRKDHSLRASKLIPKQTNKIRELMQKKPMASSITITALQDQQSQSPTFTSPLQYNENLKKKSMMSPRYSESPNFNPPHISPPVKRSTFYQYELEHNNFPLTNEYVIAEDEMEDSPHKIFSKRQNSPSYYHQIDEYDLQKRGYTSRQRAYEGKKRQPRTKYSSFLNKETLTNNLQTEPDSNQRVRPFSFRENQPNSNEPYPIFDRFGNPGSTSPQNRMTSINININNHEQKKQDHKINVKYNPKTNYNAQNHEKDWHFKAQKKRKIRQKAAALLNRVKSQEYMRPFSQFEAEFNNPHHYYDNYYH